MGLLDYKENDLKRIKIILLKKYIITSDKNLLNIMYKITKELKTRNY